MSSVTEGNLGLNYGWAYGESGWNTGMDDNLVKLGFTSRNQVKGILSAPPSTPSNGDAYIVGTSPTGLFSGNFGKVAIWDRTVWLFLTPKNHEVVYNVADGCDYIYDNGWVLKQEDELSPYVKVKDFTFSTGYTITDQKQCLLNLVDNKYYQWFGALPKVVPAGSTPETSGGIGASLWVNKLDVTLRAELLSNIGATLINTSSGDTVQSEIDSKLPLAGGNLSGKLEIVEDSDIDYLNTSQLTISGPNDTILCFDRLGLFTAGFGVDANNNLVYGGNNSSLGMTHKVWHDGISAKNVNTNGYQKLPSGLILQWGEVSTTSGTSVTASLPITFPTLALQGVVSHDNPDDSVIYYANISFPSASQIKIKSERRDGAAIDAVIRYFVIGV